MTNDILSAKYNNKSKGHAGTDEIYKGEIFVTTVRGEHELEKNVYIRNTFVSEGVLNLDANPNDLAFKYSAGTLRELIDNGIIKKEDGEKLIEEIRSEEERMHQFVSWLQENPEATEEDKNNFFRTHASSKPNHDYVLSLRRLITSKNAIQNHQIKSLPLFSKNLDSTSDFGMTKPIADGLAHLPTLLYESTYEEIIENTWKLSAKITNKRNKDDPEIALEYNFLASSKEEAERTAENYKNRLKKGGLKVLLSYWKMANIQGKFAYNAKVRDIMELTSKGNRDSYYNMEERKKFWATSRILESSKISIPVISKSKKKKSKKIKVEHRLLEILGRSTEEDETGCPTEVRVRVMDSSVFEDQAQLATAIADNILSLDENDVLLAFSLEARASQRREYETISVDPEYLIDRGNLRGTAKSNPRAAKAKYKQKLDRLKEAQAGVVDWQETKDEIVIITKKQRPSSPKRKKI